MLAWQWTAKLSSRGRRTAAPWVSTGVVVAVLVVADLVDVFPLTKCLNIGVGIGVGAVVAQDGGVSHSQRSSSPSVSDVASHSSKSGRGGCSRDEAKA